MLLRLFVIVDHSLYLKGRLLVQIQVLVISTVCKSSLLVVMHEFVIGGILRDDDVVVDSETGIKLHPDLQINQLQAPEMQQVDETPIPF